MRNEIRYKSLIINKLIKILLSLICLLVLSLGLTSHQSKKLEKMKKGVSKTNTSSYLFCSFYKPIAHDL